MILAFPIGSSGFFPLEPPFSEDGAAGMASAASGGLLPTSTVQLSEDEAAFFLATGFGFLLLPEGWQQAGRRWAAPSAKRLACSLRS